MPCGLPNDPVMTSRLAFARLTLGVALVHRPTAAERDRGQELLAEVSDVFLRRATQPVRSTDRRRLLRHVRGLGAEIAMSAIPLMRAAVDDLFREGQLLVVGHSGDRCSGGDTARSRGRR